MPYSRAARNFKTSRIPAPKEDMTKFSYRTPPLECLRGFVAVARRLSISTAAEDLFLTPSAVSRQVSTFEEYLGTALFVRRHRAIVLTPIGEKLFELASPWQSQLIDFSEEVRTGERSRLPVTLTANIGVTSLWILPRLGLFQAAHPDIDNRVAASNRIMVLEQEGIDLAIRYCKGAAAPRGAVRLFGEDVVPVANKIVAARAFKNDDQFSDEIFLELDFPAHPWLRWSDWTRAPFARTLTSRRFLHFNQYDQVIQAAIEGHGIALGRVPLILPMLKDGRLVALSGAQVEQSDFAYWLITSSEPMRSEARIFVDWIIAHAANDATALQKAIKGAAIELGERSESDFLSKVHRRG